MPEITPLEAANLADALEKSLPQKVSYANLVGAESCYGDTYVWEDPEPYMIAEAIQFLRAIAAGEYKQVVRCRDCEHWQNDGVHGYGMCRNLNVKSVKFDADFCSYGKRKEETHE